MNRFLRAATGVFFAVHGVMALAAPPPLTCPTISMAPTSLPNGDLATAYTPTVTSSGGTAPVIVDITHGVLPTGVNLTDNGNGTATFSGTSTQTGSFEFTITATDANGCSGGRTYAPTFATASQTITFTSTAPAAATVGGPTYNVTATATSGLPVAFTIDATASGVCSIAGSTVSFIGVGTCVIDANQAGNASYGPAPQVQQSFAVAQGAQTITFTSTAPAAATVGGATYTATATATSGLPVTLTIDASASSVCSIAGSTVSFTAVGTCVIDANQAGDANYTPATQVQQSFAVGQGSQTITFTSTAPAAAAVGGPTYNVTATASSGLTVTFTIDATAASVCSIAGSTVSFMAAGTCVIDANQAGNGNYTAAPQVQQSFAVGKGAQTITFTSIAPAGAIVGGPTYNVTATATSGLVVALTIDASASGVCTIAGSTVSFIGAGTCVIDANQAGDANYNAAPQVQQSFAVGKGNQTVTFTSTAPVGATVGGPTYTVTATASSGLVVTLTIDASASAVCSISGSTVSFIGAGTCVIDGNQAGNANYNAAPQAQQAFVVGKGSQTITFTSTAPAGATFGGATYTVTATASSGLVVTFTIDAAAATVCSISGSTVSFIGAGTCVIDANQAGNANYNAAPQVQQSFVVAKSNQTISFTSTPPATPTVGGPTYTVTATATSGLAVSFTIDASATSFCSISGSTVSFTAVGTCVIDANQAGNANYNAASQVQQSFQVDQAPAITSANNTTFAPGKTGQTFTVNTTGFPSGASMSITQGGTVPSAVTFTNNNNGTATIAGTPAAGTQGSSPYAWTITANNGVAPNANQSFTFNVVCPAITVSGAIPALTFNTVMASTTFTQVGGNGAIAWTATGLPAGVSINGATGAVTGTPTVTGTFSAMITATDAGACTGSKSQSVTVAPVAVADAESGLIDNTQFVLTGGTTTSPATPFVGAAGSLITNDLPSGAVTATAGTFASSGGGSVTLAADGTFIYTPKANPTLAAITSDSFTYTISSNTGGTPTATTANGTVTLTLAGRVWYIKNNGAAGNGQSQSSFSTLAAGIAASTANDTIYIYAGDGTTTNLASASILKTGQSLIGQGVAFPIAGVTNAPAAGGFPIIGNTITLASNVTVNGIDMTTGAANGIVGTGVTGLNVTPRNVTSTTGTAVSIGGAGNTGTMTFTKVNTTGAAKGISVSNFTGAFSVNGTGGLCDSGHITAADCTGGTLQGASTRGVEFVNVSNGASTSITLKNVYLKGDGTTGIAVGPTCNPDVGAGNNTGCNAALYFNGVTNVSLDRMFLDGGSGSSQDNGINANGVNGFTFTNSEVKNFWANQKDAANIQNPSGTWNIGNTFASPMPVTFDNNRESHNWFITSNSGTSNITFTNTTISNSPLSATGNASGITALARGGSTVTLTADHCTFTNVVSNAVNWATAGGGHLTSVLSNGTATQVDTVQMTADGNNSVMNYTITNMTITTQATTGHSAIVVGRGDVGPNGVNVQETGTVTNNTITVNSSTCSTCLGISLNSYGQSGLSTTTVTGNTISGNVFNGINLNAGAGNNSYNLTLQNNTMSTTQTPVNTGYAMDLISGLTGGDGNCVFINLGDMSPGHAVPANRNNLNGNWTNGTPNKISAAIFFNAQFKLLNYAGATDAAAGAYIGASNVGGADAFHAGTLNFAGGAVCP